MLAIAPHAPATHNHVPRPEWDHRARPSSAKDAVRRTPAPNPAPATAAPPAAAAPAPTTPMPPANPPAAPAASAAPTPARPVVTPMERLPDGSLDLGSYPSTDLLRLLAALLSQITTSNDRLRPDSAPLAPPTPPTDPVPDAHVVRPPIWSQLTSASRISLATPTATLAFHARNIPSITIEQYLLRILKYCPTTNEVFLGLLVYFDRMSKLAAECAPASSSPTSPSPLRPFAIDSFNIHRLLIAGVTVASKFFSDVFYTNSRYAKVGGLPQSELNQLELQFLLLNDFRLSIPIDEMQRYAEQLLQYSAGMSPEDAFAPSATAPPPPPPVPSPIPAPLPPAAIRTRTEPESHRPAHLQLRPNTTIPAAAGSPGHLSTSFSTSTYPRTSHHDVEARAWHATNGTPTVRRPAMGTAANSSTSDAASIYSVDASESGYGSTTDEEPTIRAHWSSEESIMTEDGEGGTTDDGASTGTVEDRDLVPDQPEPSAEKAEIGRGAARTPGPRGEH
ncbi:cyclin-domain-containing protein [Ceratobasidium sp. AG-I]|nr:cyclin-domain-containing protein [Ceratobasidium sp. AG-I]